MSLLVSHHLFTTTPPKIHDQFLSLKQKHTKKVQSATSPTCKIQLNPFKEILPRKQPPAQPSIFPPDYISPPEMNPLQKLIASSLDMLEESILRKAKETQKFNRMNDPAIQLEGNHAPVQESPVRHDLQVVGTIPKSVQGVYLRNGGNPLFTPISGHHFFDGDGMIHAINFVGEDRASYCCRFTRTNRLVREVEMGKPVFPKPIGELSGHLGLTRLAIFVARALAGVVNIIRGSGLANAGLIYFNGRLLAISEDDLPYHVQITKDGDLETIGRFNFNGQLKDALIAHPKVDPITKDLYSLSYNVLLKPHLKFFKFDKWGNKLSELPISLKEPTMIHDFAMSENYVIIPDHQVVFKLCEMMWDKSPVVYKPNKVSRFGVLPKDATHESMIQWIDVPDCFCFHMWNAWEEYNEHGDKIIVVINSCMTPVDSIFSGGADESLKSQISEIRLNLKTGISTRRVIVSGMNLEAGMVNKQLLGQRTRYVYLAIADPWPKVSGIGKVDLDTGHVTKYLFGGQRFGGEPCFVPANEEDGEEEGFVMSFVRDEENETSELVVLKASSMEQVALVKLPTRVPYGFHGTFVSPEELEKQAFN
ncbi:hypothetical protein RD792_009682 [Penstemon davidsonii]|uniref:9-cis-epoxycarotenoid dioxygenase n=1 Tax=Penstemon davidsonii TaxID=160366 RepID=A0ABR0CZR9_9LAMI|nr:hypothetical protein RD792_009682 [Penstemon davidsonii]